jgi:ATP-dependent Clp protease ATP-binding subunit ClpB
VKIQFAEISKLLAQQDISLSATTDAIEWMSQLGYDPQYGARPLKRMLQKRIVNELSKQLLAGEVEKGQSIVVDVFNNEIVFRGKIDTEK